MRRVELAHLGDRGDEVVEVAPVVAVVRPEAGQVDVADEGDAVGLDDERRLCPRVWPGRCSTRTVTPPRSNTSPSAKPVAPGMSPMWKSSPSSSPKRPGVLGRQAVDRQQPVERAHAVHVVERGRGRASPPVAPRPAMWSSCAWLTSTRSTPGTPPRACTVSDGSIRIAPSVPRTSVLLPSGYLPRRHR